MPELVFGKGVKCRPQHFAVQPFLAGKVVIDGGLVHARLGDNGAHAGRVVAAFGKQPLGGFEDALARDFGRSRHGLGRLWAFFKLLFEFQIWL